MNEIETAFARSNGGEKGRWEYFCQLMAAVPSLASVFSDYHPDGMDLAEKIGRQAAIRDER